VPGSTSPAGALDADAAVEGVPRIPSQSGNVANRFGQLASLGAFPGAMAALRGVSEPEDVPARLTDLVAATARTYLTHGHASPVLLVHTATAPNAVRHTLPALPKDLWAPSLTAAWSASAALLSTYAPVEGAPREVLPEPPAADDMVADVLERANANGDEHVLKFTDTAVDAYDATGDPETLAAALRVGQLLGPG
jgi:hypothetical protein